MFEPIERWHTDTTPLPVILNRMYTIVYHDYNGEQFLCAWTIQVHSKSSDEHVHEARLGDRRHQV